jgi:beta-phosphoglucomutase
MKKSAQAPALLFDMDGVIVDSTATHTLAWKQYLAQHGIEVSDIERRMLGKHNDEIVRDFFGNSGLSDSLIFNHGAEKERLYRQMLRPRLRDLIVKGLPEFLERHGDLHLGVASNAEPANVEFVLEEAGIAEYFDAVVNGRIVARPKPAPDVYLRAAEYLGVTPADCVVFEDSLTGVAAARAAGMSVVGVRTTIQEFPDVDLTIGNFEDPDLEPWLRDLRQFA